jgi:hypothetical protein
MTTSNNIAEKEKILVCNEENGCMSQLFGRNCWVANSFIGLIESHAETLYEKNLGDSADEVCKSILEYCKQLKQDNKDY